MYMYFQIGLYIYTIYLRYSRFITILMKFQNVLYMCYILVWQLSDIGFSH